MTAVLHFIPLQGTARYGNANFIPHFIQATTKSERPALRGASEYRYRDSNRDTGGAGIGLVEPNLPRLQANPLKRHSDAIRLNPA
jgi:hypothetical protein